MTKEKIAIAIAVGFCAAYVAGIFLVLHMINVIVYTLFGVLK